MSAGTGAWQCPCHQPLESGFSVRLRAGFSPPRGPGLALIPGSLHPFHSFPERAGPCQCRVAALLARGKGLGALVSPCLPTSCAQTPPCFGDGSRQTLPTRSSVSAQCGSVVMGKWAPGLAGPPARPRRCLSNWDSGPSAQPCRAGTAGRGSRACEQAGGEQDRGRQGARADPMSPLASLVLAQIWILCGPCAPPAALTTASGDQPGPPGAAPLPGSPGQGCSSCARLLWGLCFHIPDFSFLIPPPTFSPSPGRCHHLLSQREDREGGGQGHLLMLVPLAESPAPHLLVL